MQGPHPLHSAIDVCINTFPDAERNMYPFKLLFTLRGTARSVSPNQSRLVQYAFNSPLKQAWEGLLLDLPTHISKKSGRDYKGHHFVPIFLSCVGES